MWGIVNSKKPFRSYRINEGINTCWGLDDTWRTWDSHLLVVGSASLARHRVAALEILKVYNRKRLKDEHRSQALTPQ